MSETNYTKVSIEGYIRAKAIVEQFLKENPNHHPFLERIEEIKKLEPTDCVKAISDMAHSIGMDACSALNMLQPILDDVYDDADHQELEDLGVPEYDKILNIQDCDGW